MFRKKKILYLVTKSNWGGAQKYVFDLATHFQQEYEIAVAHGGRGILAEKLQKSGIKTIEINDLERDINFLKELKVFFELLKLLKKEKPDIIHLNSPKISGLGAVAGRIMGIKKIIFTSHGWPFNEERLALSKLIFLLLSYFTVLLSHRTIAVSQKELEQTLNWPFVRHKISQIYNGIDEIRFKDREDARQFLSGKITELKTRENAIWIGTISELHPNKGLKYAVKALKKLKNEIIFVIIGGGEEEKKLKNLIKETGLEKNVFLAGFIDNAGIYLKAFDIFLLSSVKEGLAYTNLEAGLAGLPVVATKVGGMPEIVNNGKTGLLVKPKNSSEIYSALKKLLENPQEGEKLGKALKKHVEQNFSLKQMLKKTSAIYKTSEVQPH